MEILRFPRRAAEGASVKKHLAALSKYTRGQGGLPSEAIEADIVERYGWTYEELDSTDEDRVYTGYTLQNVRDCSDRVRAWIDSQGKIRLGSKDMEVYGLMLDAEKEIDPKAETNKENIVEGLTEFLSETEAINARS